LFHLSFIYVCFPLLPSIILPHYLLLFSLHNFAPFLHLFLYILKLLRCGSLTRKYVPIRQYAPCWHVTRNLTLEHKKIIAFWNRDSRRYLGTRTLKPSRFSVRLLSSSVSTVFIVFLTLA
jgi:hypothetical protein